MKIKRNQMKDKTLVNVYLRGGELVGQTLMDDYADYVTSAKGAEGFVTASDWLRSEGCRAIDLAANAVVYFTEEESQ